MSIAALVLAAGGSTRLGQPKQLLLIDGEPLLRRTVRAVLGSGVDQAAVVLGAEAERCAAALADLPVTRITNDRWRDGMASSLVTGLSWLRGQEAIVIATCDQLALTSAVLDRLIEEFRAHGRDLVASDYGGASGTPALFGARWFPALSGLQGDTGARALFRAAGPALVTLPFPGGEWDLDTWADYERLAPQV